MYKYSVKSVSFSVTITRPAGFSSAVIQFRQQFGDNEDPIGVIDPLTNNILKKATCTNKDDTAYINNKQATTVQLTWTAPSIPVGDVALM